MPIENILGIVFVWTPSGKVYGGQFIPITDHNGLIAQHVGVHDYMPGAKYLIRMLDGTEYNLPAESATFQVPPNQWDPVTNTPEEWGKDVGVLSFSSPVFSSWVEIDPNFVGGSIQINTVRAGVEHKIVGRADDGAYNMISMALSEPLIPGDSGSGVTYPGPNGVPMLVGTATLAGLKDGVHNNSAGGPDLSGFNYQWVQEAIAASNNAAINRWQVVEQVDAFYREVEIPGGLPAGEVSYWQGQADNGLNLQGTVALGATVSSVKVAVSREMLGLDITWNKVTPFSTQLDQGVPLATIEGQLLTEYAAAHGGVIPGNGVLVPVLAQNILGQALSPQDQAFYVHEFDVNGAPEMLAALATNVNVVGILAPINAASDHYLG